MGETPRQRSSRVERSGSGAPARKAAKAAPASRRGGKAPKRKPRFFGRWYVIVPVALILLAAIIGFWYYPSMKVAYHEARNERILGAQLAAVNKYNAQLQEEVKSLETTAGVEEYARRELNLVEKGDHVVIVTRDGKPIASDEVSRVTALENISAVKKPFGTWTSFLDRLFGPE
ncbi:MAG: septum formation initiator family protein [Coriobacteriia bacterium]|nr:septum formation initiator family protein [Coriobacteriia bacterium]